MNPLRQTEYRTVSDRQLQDNLERLVIARKRKDEERAARFMQPEPVNFCADVAEPEPAPKWIVWGHIAAYVGFLVAASAIAFFWHTEAVQGFLLMLRAQA